MKLEDFKRQVEDFLTATADARFLSERDRDYKDNKQWTAEEEATLLSRNQAPITVNRVRPKVEGLKGLLVQRKTDPKAYPRTVKHTKAAEAITDALRYVADNNDFDQIKLDVGENVFVEGYGAVIIEGSEDEINLTTIPWDRYYYDPHSRKLDFSDKRFDGIMLWMDAEDAEHMFDLEEEDIQNLLFENHDETFQDRPKWVDPKNKRVLIAQHFFLDKGTWKMVYFSGNMELTEQIDSPYVDEKGKPINPIEAISANIDRENNRFGEVRYWIDLQDELNHRRSKFLHLNSVRQTAARRGAITDVPALKRELAKADGHVEYDGEKGDFEVLPTGNMSDAQVLLYQDSKRELDAVGFNAQLSGERQGDLSGRAITNLQNAAINELSSLYNNLTSWEKRCYRQMWMRIRQFWTKEKWIRVLDDQSVLRWVGINQQVTVREILEEQINDESLDLIIRQESSALYNKMLEEKDPRLDKIKEIRNNVAELEVDIMLEVSMDSINTQQEQFELMAKLAQTGNLTPEIIELSPLRQKLKDKLLASMQSNAQAAAQRQQGLDELTAKDIESKSADKLASAEKKQQEAVQTHVQTQLMLETPPENTGVVI
jgi:hypothetical protein